MKKYIFIAVFLVKTIGLMAQTSRFKDGETLNVWASSGLNMRDKPDAKATKIAAIPYGAKVVVQPNIGVKIPFEIEEFKGFVVKGLWLLVKYGDKEGYIFDGFVSKLPAPVSQKEWGELEAYLDKNMGKVGDKFEARMQEADSTRALLPNEKYDINALQSYKQKYKQGILYAYALGEGGSSTRLELPNCTLYEAYLLVKIFHFNPQTNVFSFNKKDKSVNSEVKNDNGGCAFSIKQVGNKIIIDGGCGC